MKLYVFPTSPNSRKCMVMNRLLGLDVPETTINLMTGEQKAPSILALNPNGKMPLLEYDDGTSLWESNAITNRLAAERDTTLWPKSNARYDIMRWQFWEGCHLTPAASKFIARYFFGNEAIDLEAAAAEFAPLAKVLDGHLAGRDWLSGDAMTTADISVSAILCYRDACQMPLDDYANIHAWLARVEGTPAWKEVNLEPQPA